MNEAFLVHRGVLYFAKSSPRVPIDTAVSVLIHGVWAQNPARALSTLRERIHTNHALTPVCEGAIKVAAKRVSVHERAEYERRKTEAAGAPGMQLKEVLLPEEQEGFLPLSGHESVMKSLHALLARSRAEKAVAALLVGPDGDLLCGSWNTSEADRSAHAEYNLVRGFLLWAGAGGGSIPRGSTLWVTLRPCALCAGAILSASEDIAKLKIRYLEDDPGPAARNSCLLPHSDLWARAGEPSVDVALYR